MGTDIIVTVAIWCGVGIGIAAAMSVGIGFVRGFVGGLRREAEERAAYARWIDEFCARCGEPRHPPHQPGHPPCARRGEMRPGKTTGA